MILIIDDESRWVRGYKEALELSGYQCTLVTDIDQLDSVFSDDEFLQKLKLVILDIMMPPRNRYNNEDTDEGMKTGEFVLAEFKKILPNLPIVILTNKEETEQIKEKKELYYSYNQKEDLSSVELIDLVDRVIGESDVHC